VPLQPKETNLQLTIQFHDNKSLYAGIFIICFNFIVTKIEKDILTAQPSEKENAKRFHRENTLN
jgi:hypothetical protein